MPCRMPSTILRGGALNVGVLDAQNERAAEMAGKQPVEQRGTGAAYVQIPGWRGREAHAGAAMG